MSGQGAKKVLLAITSAADFGTIPAELIGCFNLVLYSSDVDAVFKALGMNKDSDLNVLA